MWGEAVDKLGPLLWDVPRRTTVPASCRFESHLRRQGSLHKRCGTATLQCRRTLQERWRQTSMINAQSVQDHRVVFAIAMWRGSTMGLLGGRARGRALQSAQKRNCCKWPSGDHYFNSTAAAKETTCIFICTVSSYPQLVIEYLSHSFFHSKNWAASRKHWFPWTKVSHGISHRSHVLDKYSQSLIARHLKKPAVHLLANALFFSSVDNIN